VLPTGLGGSRIRSCAGGTASGWRLVTPIRTFLDVRLHCSPAISICALYELAHLTGKAAVLVKFSTNVTFSIARSSHRSKRGSDSSEIGKPAFILQVANDVLWKSTKKAFI
jgi:hypothetical protein